MIIGGKVKTVMFAIPHGGFVAPEFEINYAQLKKVIPMNTTITEHRVLREPIPLARHKLVQFALEYAHPEWILFIDDDVLPPAFLLKAMMEHKEPIVSGIYWSKDKNFSKPVIFDESGGGSITNWEPCSTFPIRYAGLGCCLIHMDVFRKVPEPWFNWNYNFTVEDVKHYDFKADAGEDTYFFERAIEHGFSPVCDSRILCQHIDIHTGKLFPDIETVMEHFGDHRGLVDAFRKGAEFAVPLLSGKIDDFFKDKRVYKGVDGEKLNLGCGWDKKEGFTNIDYTEVVKPDILCDIDNEPLPIEDNSVGYVLLKHVVEHMVNIKFVMEEIYRVCKDGAIVEMYAPYFSSEDAFGDPSHVRCMSDSSMLFFNQEAFYMNKQMGTVMSPGAPNCDFDIVEVEKILKPEWFSKPDDERIFAIRHLLNVIDQIHFTLKVRKPMWSPPKEDKDEPDKS